VLGIGHRPAENKLGSMEPIYEMRAAFETKKLGAFIRLAAEIDGGLTIAVNKRTTDL
jgi:hypothetical protein